MKRTISLFLLLLVLISASMSSCTKDSDYDDIEYSSDSLLVIAKRVANVMEVAEKAFVSCKSTAELQDYLDDIRNIDGVEEVYIDDYTMFIRVEGWGLLPYMYYPDQTEDEYDIEADLTRSKTRANDTNPVDIDHICSDAKKVCVINQQINDKIFHEEVQSVDVLNLTLGKKADAVNDIINRFNDCEFHVDTYYGNDVTPEVFTNVISDYDVVFIHTHGVYDWGNKIYDQPDNMHWLLTGEEHLCQEIPDYFITKIDGNNPAARLNNIPTVWELLKDDKTPKETIRLIYEWLDRYSTQTTIEEEKDFDTSGLRIGGVMEQRANGWCLVYYTIISEKYIKGGKRFKNEKAIVYNTACQSLKENSKMADAFLNRNATCYLGWTEEDNRGCFTADSLFKHMLYGQSIKDAFVDIPREYHSKSGIWEAKLGRKGNENICIVHPETTSAEVRSKNGDFEIVLSGTNPYLDDINHHHSSNYTLGFFTSKNEDMSLSIFHPANDIKESLLFNKKEFEVVLKSSDLEAKTKYYYMPYFYDHESNKYCLGKKGEFTTLDASPKNHTIEQVVPDIVLNKMAPYMPIYTGANPPLIENLYAISPMELLYNSEYSLSYTPGKIVKDRFIHFSGQDVKNNTIDYWGFLLNYYGEIDSEEVGRGAFISGEGDNFSVYFSTPGYDIFGKDTCAFIKAIIISGTKTQKGIENIHYAFTMIDKYDPNNHLMNVNAFRVFIDSDGMADLISMNNEARSRATCPPNLIEIGLLPSGSGIDINFWNRMRKIPDSPPEFKWKIYRNNTIHRKDVGAD